MIRPSNGVVDGVALESINISPLRGEASVGACRISVVRAIVDDLNWRLAEIEHEAMKVDIKPFEEHFQVTFLRPESWIRKPGFKLYFEQ